MEKKTEEYIRFLQNHPEPIIRWKTARYLLEDGKARKSDAITREELDSSPLVSRLLSDRKEGGRIPFHAYDKWFGAHWVLSILADLGYPAGDLALKPLLEQCYAWLLSEEHARHIRVINGRTRRCASQEGNCVYYSLALGLADERTAELVSRLIGWQWEDGGWNCDKRPEAAKSSYHESLIPLRGMACYTQKTGDLRAQQAAERAAGIFLKRRLIHRIRDGQIMDPHFIKLHYPSYWHYDYLFALKVLAEAGFINQPGCEEALELLESKQLPDGGFPAEERYYRVDEKELTGHSRVDYGGTSKVHSNPFVSLDALIVLKRSGRLIL